MFNILCVVFATNKNLKFTYITTRTVATVSRLICCDNNKQKDKKICLRFFFRRYSFTYVYIHCVLRLTANSLELTEHDNHSSFKTRRNNDWSGSSNFSKPAVNNLSGFRILEPWRRLSQTHRPPFVMTPKTVAAEVKAYRGRSHALLPKNVKRRSFA